jgi:benzylsuccinate CoA-transferase BbsE subunit
VTAAGTGALCGRRILELADPSGAYCGKLLADMGADVIKIERVGGDPARRIPPLWRNEASEDTSFAFLYTNTSKRGITLNLEPPAGRDLFLQLVRKADVVIETFEPGYLNALGVGYEALARLNSRIVLTSITAFGQTGPQCHYRSSDLVASALGGALYVIGEENDPPVTLAGSQAHVSASTFAASSSLVALLHASRTGRGQHVDVSIQEAVTAVTHICGVGKWLDDGIIPKRRGTSLFASVPSGAYPCKDGLVYLMVNRPLHWKALADWIHEETGNEEVLDPMFEGPSSRRQEHRELIDLFICELTQRFTVSEVYHEGQRRHIAFTPVNSAAAVARDPQLEARAYFVSLAHPEGGHLRYPGAPYRHSRTPWSLRGSAPGVGEHNEEVYRGELGLSAEQLGALRDHGVI